MPSIWLAPHLYAHASKHTATDNQPWHKYRPAQRFYIYNLWIGTLWLSVQLFDGFVRKAMKCGRAVAFVDAVHFNVQQPSDVLTCERHRTPGWRDWTIAPSCGATIHRRYGTWPAATTTGSEFRATAQKVGVYIMMTATKTWWWRERWPYDVEDDDPMVTTMIRWWWRWRWPNDDDGSGDEDEVTMMTTTARWWRQLIRPDNDEDDGPKIKRTEVRWRQRYIARRRRQQWHNDDDM